MRSAPTGPTHDRDADFNNPRSHKSRHASLLTAGQDLLGNQSITADNDVLLDEVTFWARPEDSLFRSESSVESRGT